MKNIFLLSDKLISTISEHVDIDFNGYKSYVFQNTRKTKECADLAREMHKFRLESIGYKGYDDEVDKNYHSEGTYFIVLNENQLVMTSRVNARCSISGFPFEMAEVVDGEKYVCDEDESSLDINTYSLSPAHRKQAMPILLASLGNYLYELGVTKAYCLVDSENFAVQKIYKDSKFIFSKSFSSPIYFPTFTRGETDKPVIWKVMEWNKVVIYEHAKSYSQYSMLEGAV